jgi:hypothetical protein
MKKLIVVALSVVMILSFAAVSMAATVNVGGELNFGWDLSVADEATTDLNQFADTKVGVTAALTDEVSAFAAVKSTDFSKAFIDETWVKFSEDFGSVKVGYFEYVLDGDVDIIPSTGTDSVSNSYFLKNKAGIAAAVKVAEPITVGGYLARFDPNAAVGDDMETKYAVTAAYDTEAFGAKVNYVGTTEEDVDAYETVNLYYNLAPAKVYLDYEFLGDSNDNAIVGALYEGDKIYGRVEYQAVKPDSQDDANIGYRIGYKLGGGAKIEYNNMSINGADAVSSVKLNLLF